MPFNESPCFNCGRLPSEGHTARCNADFNPAFEDVEATGPAAHQMLSALRFGAVVDAARRLHAQGGTHECGEWTTEGKCAVCGTTRHDTTVW